MLVRALFLFGGIALTYALAFAAYRVAAQHAAPTLLTLDQDAPAARVGDDVTMGVFNIAHGRGTGDDNPSDQNHTGGDASVRDARLSAIAQQLREIGADVWVLNEVDFASRWSFGTNQALTLAERAGYPYVAYVANLDVPRWVPGGPWQFGNAILSRYPLSDCRTLALPGYSIVETALAGKKRGLSCVVGGALTLFALHLSHRDENVRTASARFVLAAARDAAAPAVIAGDLNSTRPGWPQLSLDETGTSAIEVLELSARPQLQMPPHDAPTPDTMTFHSQAPKSVIDWIAVPEAWMVVDTQVHPTTLSDHRAITTRVRRNARPHGASGH